MPDFRACGTAQKNFWTRTICPAGCFQKHGPLMWLWEWYALGWWLCPDLAGFGTIWVSSQKLWHRKTGQGEVHCVVEFFMLWIQWVDVSQESISSKKPPESSNFTRKIRFRKSSNLKDVNWILLKWVEILMIMISPLCFVPQSQAPDLCLTTERLFWSAGAWTEPPAAGITGQGASRQPCGIAEMRPSPQDCVGR